MSDTDESAALVGVVSVSTEAISNERWPEQLATVELWSATLETIDHLRYGESMVAEVLGLSKEFIAHERYGQSLQAEHCGVVSERLVGDRYAKPIYNETFAVCVEMLIAASPYSLTTVCGELLVDDPNAPTSVSHMLRQQTQTVLTKSKPWPDPSTVWSWTHVHGIAQQALASNKQAWPLSPSSVHGVREQTVQRRVFPPLAEMISASPVRGYRQIAVVSKSMKVVAISAVFTKGVRTQAVTARVTDRPDTLQGSIMVKGVSTLAIRTRGAMPFAVDVHAARLRQFAMTAREPTAPISPNSVKVVAQQVVIRKVMEKVADGRAAMLKQTAITRAANQGAPRSPEYAKQTVQQVVAQSNALKPISYNEVERVRSQVIARRWAPMPGFLLGWRIPAVKQYAVVEVDRGRNWSPVLVASSHKVFITQRETVAPIDVIDPSVGRHAKSLVRTAALSRKTMSPVEVVKQSRFVSNVVEVYVLSEPPDSLPPPPTEEPKPPLDSTVFLVGQAAVVGDHAGWSAVSALRIQLSGEAVVLGDELYPWVDPRVPRSHIDAGLVYQPVAVGDEFIPSWVAQSSAEAALVAEQVALGDDSLPGTDVARSDAELLALAEQVALEDGAFPSTDVALSDAIVTRVALTPVYGDHGLRTLPVSPTTAYNLVELLIMADPMLMRMSRRRAGARPVVSVTLS